ncbi:RAD55 family ATPase [Campylobacter ureolyticus]|uniref:RAD55 family ATPase n=1 Tax=Campylobacter ureolyticus TaxID=827 RepID=UPI00288956CC|nr:DnaB-like helicase C-terminal domain-containing protein [Campylobacter ureolyticus]
MNLELSKYENPIELKEALASYKEEIEKAIDELDCLDEKFEYENMAEFIKRVKSEPPLKIYRTNIPWLDSELYQHGLAQGTFLNIAGASFAGKTTLTIELLKGLARENKVAFFSFEMYEKLLIRKFEKTKNEILENMAIIQAPATLESVTKRIKMLNKQGYEIFAIDSRMKISCDPKLSEYEKNSLISMRLSELTRNLGVIVILINQISEGDQKAGRLALKGSGDQFYDSDMIMFLNIEIRDDGDVKRELTIAKDRVGGKVLKIKVPDFKNSDGVIKAIEFDGGNCDF